MKLTLEECKKMMEENVGSLYLHGTQITALPDNLTVGGYLDLSGTQITALPDNLTVGGSLDLRETQITALPSSLCIGGCLYIDETKIPNIQKNRVKKLKDRDYVPGKYIYADRILTHVKSCRKAGDYTLYIGKIKGNNVVTDGEYYAHCKNLRDGIADITFKRAKNRGTEQYENIDLDKKYAVDELKTMYRVITGACRAGTEAFVNSLGEKLKSEYTIKEAISITSGQYGSEKFTEFFI